MWAAVAVMPVVSIEPLTLSFVIITTALPVAEVVTGGTSCAPVRSSRCPTCMAGAPDMAELYDAQAPRVAASTTATDSARVVRASVCMQCPPQGGWRPASVAGRLRGGASFAAPQ